MPPDHGAFAEFSHTHAALPERFHVRVPPTPVAAPALIAFNDDLASELGVDRSQLSDAQLAAICAGNRVPDGALPLAMADAGHQSGSFVPQLGDGRALLIGEVVDVQGRRRDCSGKAQARRRSRGAAMAARHSDRCCASTS